MRVIFNEKEATEILNLINEKVAKSFCKPIHPARFVFLSYIATNKRDYSVLGQCIHGTVCTEIQIVMGPGWQNVAVHELVHMYNPGATEKKVRQLTNNVIKYLKVIN